METDVCTPALGQHMPLSRLKCMSASKGTRKTSGKNAKLKGDSFNAWMNSNQNFSTFDCFSSSAGYNPEAGFSV
jgi:hypothetical protein